MNLVDISDYITMDCHIKEISREESLALILDKVFDTIERRKGYLSANIPGLAYKMTYNCTDKDERYLSLEFPTCEITLLNPWICTPLCSCGKIAICSDTNNRCDIDYDITIRWLQYVIHDDYQWTNDNVNIVTGEINGN